MANLRGFSDQQVADLVLFEASPGYIRAQGLSFRIIGGKASITICPLVEATWSEMTLMSRREGRWQLSSWLREPLLT